jgi:transposase
MLRKDLKVKRPEKTKLSKQRNCIYVYHVVDSDYKKDKQYVIDKRVSIGKMIDDEYMHPNDNYFLYYSLEDVEEKEPEFSDALQVATVALLQKIMKDTKLDELLNEVHGENAAIIKDLVCYVIIRQSSTMQHYSDYAFRHLLCSRKRVDDTRISELFKNQIGALEIEEFQERWNAAQQEKSGIYISYDSTNMNTQAEGIEMAEFGYAKEDSEIPQVNLSYAVKQSDATPLFYEMYPGSIIDNSQCAYMVSRAKAYGYQEVGFILDRGHFSKNNIRHFDDNDYGFLMMIKSNSKIVENHLKEARLPLLTKSNYYIPEHEVHGLTVVGKFWEKDEKKRYIHIFYDNVRGSEERNRYLEQIYTKEKKLEKKVDEKLRREEELLGYKRHFKLKFDFNGYLEGYYRNESNIKKEVDRLGFFVLITSEEMSAGEALSIYRNRDSTEKLFRALKTGLEFDTYRVHSQKSLEGKTHVMFIASIVRNRMFQVLKENRGKDKKNFTVPAAISELEKVIAIKDKNGKYVRRYGLTAKQKKVLKPFGIDDKYLNKILMQID